MNQERPDQPSGQSRDAEAKSQLTREWLVKAQHDLRAARCLSVENPPILDVAIYHCQQAAEKALKGLLVYSDFRFGKTHELKVLVDLASRKWPSLGSIAEPADRLTDYCVEFRYPGEYMNPTQGEFGQALADSTTVYEAVLALLPRPVHP